MMTDYTTKEFYDQSWKKSVVSFGVSTPRFVYSSPERLAYYIREMENRIQEEVSETGHCWLMDIALANMEIYSWDWTAFQVIYCQLTQKRYVQVHAPNKGLLEITQDEVDMILEFYKVAYKKNVSDTKEKQQGAKQECELTAHQAPPSYTSNASLKSSDETREKVMQSEAKLQSWENKLKVTLEKLNNAQNQLAVAQQEEQTIRQNIKKEQEAAKVEAERIVAEARQNAQAIKSSMIHTIAAEMSSASPEPQASALTRSDVEDKVRMLENKLREELVTYREQLQNEMQTFRSNLFATEYGGVCDAYQRLYQYVTKNLEKQIKSLEGQPDKETCQQDMRDIQARLLQRLERFKRGIEAMGMTFIWPEVGSDYTWYEHSADNAEDDGSMVAKVKLCVCPGIRNGTQVICKAVVLVDEQ